MSGLKIWLISFVSFIILDFLWLGTFGAKFYRSYLTPIAKLKPNGQIDFNFLAGGLVYLLMATGFTVFVAPKIISADSVWKAAGLSALFGLVLFGVYDLTNLTFAKYWPLNFAAADVLWGTVASTIVGIIFKLLIK